MTLVDRFDNWVQQGPFTSRDLGIYRIIYASCALLLFPRIAPLADLPNFMFHPPVGLMQLFPGIPPRPILIGLEVVSTVALVLLGLGVRTRTMSILTSVLILVICGLKYSFGKIDHDILLILTPLVLSFANWGDALSIDAYRAKASVPTSTPQWPLRLLALIVGLSFFNAALLKLSTGWLSFSSQAAEAQFYASVASTGRVSWLTEAATHVHLAGAWELVDWATVIIEFSLLITVFWWRAFRISIAFAVLFHLGVAMLMAIAFAVNVAAYGAFVSWGKIVPGTKWALALPVLAVVGRLGVSLPFWRLAVVIMGSIFAICYFATVVWESRPRRRGSQVNYD